MDTKIDCIGNFEVNPKQRELFISGNLMQVWKDLYPDLFDEDDLRIAKNQRSYHFYEWLSAILLYESTGFLSLVEKYQFSNHVRLQTILRQIVTSDVFDLLINSYRLYKVQCPDLLVYSPDLSDYFFCEVKGPSDRVRQVQVDFFTRLQDVSKKRVCYMQFRQFKKNKLLHG